MAKYIPLDAVLAELKRRLHFDNNWIEGDKRRQTHTNGASSVYYRMIGSKNAYESFLDFIETIEVKEVDLEKEIDRVWDNTSDAFLEDGWKEFEDIAKHFFELGLNASNPITKVNLESLVRQVIDLYLEAGKHYNSVIKEERKEYSGSNLAIKLLDGAIDAKELGIQYVLGKLKAQKEE